MRTTLNLDDDLIREAGPLTGFRAKTDVIHEGLRARLFTLATLHGVASGDMLSTGRERGPGGSGGARSVSDRRR